MTQGLPSAPLRAGSSFGDRFQIERILGSGGMGSVYEATDLFRRKLVALKVLRFRREFIDDAGARFRREAEILSSLDHDNIVQILDYGYASDGTPWLTMELLEGETLRSRLERSGALSKEELVELLKAAASALGEAHERGVIHRDLKPEHFFLLPSGSLKLLDFGLSLSASSKRLTKKGAIVGTPRYMAPEQILAASDAGAQADVYALGIVAYESLAGVSPFNAEDHGQLLGAISQGRSVPLIERCPDVSARLSRVIERAIAPDEHDRFRTPVEFAETVAHIVETPEPPSKRWPWMLAVFTVVAVSVALWLALAQSR